MLPAEYPRHRPVRSTLFPCHVWWARFWRPLFRGRKAAIHEALVPADLLAVVELVEKGAPERQQDPALLPLAEPAPAGRRAPVSGWQFTPRRARPQHPEDALEAAARGRPRPAAAGVG